jgi:methylenetetrahydrofolate reductase (NADPH)
MKVLLGESLVGEQGSPDIPDSDQCRVPGAISSEHLSEVIVESCDLVADTGMSELPEEGKVLSDLSAGQPESGSQLFRTDGSSTCSDQGAHLPKIEAESLDGGPGNLGFGLHGPSLSEPPYNPVAMHIDDVFARDHTTFSFEFFPPRSAAGWSTLEATLESLESFQPSFVSVTYGAAGSTRERTHDLVRRLKQETPLDPAPHLTCMMHDPQEINAILEQYARSGISNLVTIRGDVPTDMHADDVFKHFKHAADLVKTIREFNDSGVHPDPRGFGICVAGFPEGHPETPNTLVQMDHLKAKVDAGADWICSQLFFDNNAFYDWCERCEIAGIKIPIIAGIMPVTTIKGLKRMAELAAGTRFPASLLRSMHRIQDDPEAVTNVGTHWATEQCRDLIDRKTTGIHFYTLNRSQATASIFKTLGASDASGLRS